ncbi:MAG TPA: biotin carboxylase N-terminal domain-containing protein [Afifellaceae bacterium]|nr:biotin carboxylase N-terminal domain-containing protein [Afifellaceae bacterium]
MNSGKEVVSMIKSLLIANRGEIACRIIRTARRLGIRTIAVFTDADRSWLHWQMADEAVCIGDGPAAGSYLDGGKIIAVAREHEAEAVHPGYGFLSENAGFAQECADAGIVFVGPSADAIRAMGSKSDAKALMEKAGVPVVPGYHGSRQQPEFLKQKAYETGYPVMIKAVAGGGGRGMRIVEKVIEFDDQLASAKREALSAFGDDRVLIERYVSSPRHIEVQVFGDAHGNVVHLFERDCSVQRRHQKVIEESPAPDLPEPVRQAMGEAAVEAARAVDYQGAGTVEFIADGDGLSESGGFFFMEMNTRLQVEHPVTEMVTGLDLVEWQLRVASGEALPLGQEALGTSGHAVEVRLYAEDPAADFQPCMGRLWAAAFPDIDNVRIDTGVTEGSVVSPFYDSMLGKLIAHAPDRSAATALLERALATTRIAGVGNNIGFLRAILRDPEFAAGGVETGYVDRRIGELASSEPDRTLAGLAVLDRLRQEHASGTGAGGPWEANHGFEVGGLVRMSAMDITINGQSATAELSWPAGRLQVSIDGKPVTSETGDAEVIRGDGTTYVLADGGQLAVAFPSPLERISAASGGSGHVSVPMHGRIASVRVAAGDQVAAGDLLFTLEAMKMEHSVSAPVDGVIARILIADGEQVDSGSAAVVIEPAESAAPVADVSP